MHYPRHQGSYLMKKGTWFPSLYSSPSIPCSQRPLSFLVFCFLCQECYTFFLSWANSHKTSKDSMQTRLTSTRRLCCLSPAPSSLFICLWLFIYHTSLFRNIWSAGLCLFLSCQIFVNHAAISITINNSFLPVWTKQYTTNRITDANTRCLS